MTYNEIVEIGEAVFEEYAPKINSRNRRAIIDSFINELESSEVLAIDPDPVEGGNLEDELDF